MSFRALSLFVRSDVAALYVDALGPYPKLVARWYDAEDDALSYDGPLPVVAHPPCGPWGRLRHLSKKDRADLAPLAVAQVRRWGGVLEHPAHSKLWDACSLPKPGEPLDLWGGGTLRVDQSDFGHVARKPTWLYIVGGTPGPMPPKREPTHWISGTRAEFCGTCTKTRAQCKCESFSKTRAVRGCVPAGIKVCGKEQCRRTPVPFAAWLLDLAASARAPEGLQLLERAAEPVAVAVPVDPGDAP